MENHGIPSLGERLYLVRELYARLWSILDAVCTGNLLIPDTPLNQYYVKLCILIENELQAPDLLELSRDYRRPFESLYNLQDADIDWEYNGSVFVTGFFGRIEELWILNGQQVHKDPQVHDFLIELDQYIEQYKTRKKKIETNWVAKVKKQAEEWKADVGEFKLGELTGRKNGPQKEILPDNQFTFVTDSVLKRVIQRDYEELKKVYDIGAFKSVMVLSGGILEALLIEALSVEEGKAKFDHYQKYLESKDKNAKPPDIEKWQFYQLIEIAAQRKIISEDVKKISFVIKDYRNLIHLKAEIRDKLSVDKNVASSVVHLLLKAIDDVSKWFKERNSKV
jgi:hypothetical protein